MVDERNRSPEHTVLRQVRQPIHKPCVGLHKEHEHALVQDTSESKPKEVTRKVVRSAYFQHKKVEKNDYDDKQANKSEAGTKKNSITEGDSSGNLMKNIDLKRKTSPNDNVHNENLQPRSVCPTSPPHDNGYSDHNDDTPLRENNNGEEKFGVNISHLGHYSEIAEKSVERFASLISSFRCSSGSRASGLRAPLRDVRNTCNKRPTNVDFGQYAYVSKQRKNSRAELD
ncbi:hypothetical protein PIB30_038475 [Stylosanthes scabra]|uniref:Uncharacterized protein n=1 Tax=Stylosanthes scabra TaxID=79078 RepID=A0ABU6QDH2_9FABA|nr:hypothetical protein [Stylosanthes scabra]